MRDKETVRVGCCCSSQAQGQSSNDTVKRNADYDEDWIVCDAAGLLANKLAGGVVQRCSKTWVASRGSRKGSFGERQRGWRRQVASFCLRNRSDW